MAFSGYDLTVDPTLGVTTRDGNQRAMGDNGSLNLARCDGSRLGPRLRERRHGPEETWCIFEVARAVGGFAAAVSADLRRPDTNHGSAA